VAVPKFIYILVYLLFNTQINNLYECLLKIYDSQLRYIVNLFERKVSYHFEIILGNSRKFDNHLKNKFRKVKKKR
jgi:hypothetical protein